MTSSLSVSGPAGTNASPVATTDTAWRDDRSQAGAPPSSVRDEIATQLRDAVKAGVANPYVTALAIGSLLLSIASFFTTFAGMLHFMPIWAVTFCIVFAVQALLLVTAWRLGHALAHAERPPYFAIFVFLMCFATSAFFSWVALFESINDEDLQQRTRETRIHRAVEDAVSELRLRAGAERRERVEAMLASDAYDGWRGEVDQIAEAALAARGALETARLAEARDEAKRRATLEARRTALVDRQAGLAARDETAEQELARLLDERATLVARADQLRGEADALRERVVIQEGKMQAEATGGGGDRPAGRGPIWRELRDARNVMAAEAEAAQRLLDHASSELANYDGVIERRRADLAAKAAEDGRVETSAAIAALDQEIAALAAGGAPSGPASGALELEIAALRADLGRFATELDLAPFKAAAARCQSLRKTLLATPEAAASVADLSCDGAVLAEHLNPIATAGVAVAALDARCAPGGAEAQPVAKMGFQEAVDHGRACIALAGLPAAAVADLRGEIDRLVLEEAPNASQFVKTMNAFNGGEKLSYLTLGIAAAIDLLILFSGLIGATSGAPGRTLSRRFHSRTARHVKQRLGRALAVDTLAQHDDPVNVRNAKLVLRRIRPYSLQAQQERGRRGPINVEASIDLEEIDGDEEKIAIRQTMQALVSAGLVYSEEPDRYEIGLGALDILRQEIVRHVRSQQPLMTRLFGERRAPTRPSEPLPTRSLETAPKRIALQPSAGESVNEPALDASAPPAVQDQSAAREAAPGGDAGLGPREALKIAFDETWSEERPASTRRRKASLAEATDESEVDVPEFLNQMFDGSKRMAG